MTSAIPEIGWSLLGVGPSLSMPEELYGCPVSSISRSPWIQKSEKDKIDDLLLSGSLIIPPPQINIADFRTIALNFSGHFSLVALVKASGLGATEGAMVLAALEQWAQSHGYTEADVIKTLASNEASNPLESALKQYIDSGAIGPINVTHVLSVLKRQVLLQEALRTASPDVVENAYKLAEQQIILSIIISWAHSMEHVIDRKRDMLARQEIEDSQIQSSIIKDYIEKSELSRSALQQPTLSVVLGGGLIDSPTMAVLASIISCNGAEKVGATPKILSKELLFLAGGIVSTTSALAAPMAMSLVRYSGTLPSAALTRDAAESFALTMATILENPGMHTFIHSRIEQAVERGEISEARAEIISATFTASLLITAMASLYKAEYGGVTGKELQALVTGEMTIGDTDFCGVLAKLIREQLSSVPEVDRERILNELCSPFDQPVSLDEFTNPLLNFMAGWDPSCIMGTALATAG